MVIIKYPVEGISSLTNASLNNVINKLNEAISISNFDIPSDFGDAAYLNNINAELSQLVQGCNTIKNKLSEVDNNMNHLGNLMEANINGVELSDIKPRTPLI